MSFEVQSCQACRTCSLPSESAYVESRFSTLRKVDMMQTRSPVFDDIAQLLTGAAGAAQGVREEIETLVRAQVERAADRLDLVSREEFDAVRQMAIDALDRVEALESEVAALKPGKPAPKATPKAKSKAAAKTKAKSRSRSRSKAKAKTALKSTP